MLYIRWLLSEPELVIADFKLVKYFYMVSSKKSAISGTVLRHPVYILIWIKIILEFGDTKEMGKKKSLCTKKNVGNFHLHHFLQLWSLK